MLNVFITGFNVLRADSYVFKAELNGQEIMAYVPEIFKNRYFSFKFSYYFDN